jgi:uncharacterized membrane protein YphA (DoxX/SURF4 family)
MKVYKHILRIVVGLIFIYSGYVKGIDPLGTAYKFSDYFEAFGLMFLQPLALPMSLLMNAAEFIIGIALLSGFRMKVAAWAVFGFMCLFTPITFILAIYNPVSDCGCFGDAIILTNWQTFWKNVIIMLMVLGILFNRNKFIPKYKPFTEWGFVGLVFLVFLWLSFHSLNHLPNVDFRPYKVGQHIPDAMIIPDDVPQDIYETVFYYKNIKSDKVKKFNSENYPWEDTLNWEFVSYENKLIKKGYEPPIHDFSISNAVEGDITDLILSDPGYTFLLVCHDLKKSNKEKLKEADVISEWTKQNDDISFYCLTSSTDSRIETTVKETGVGYSFYATDEITLKTIVRSNPGLVLLKEGTVIGKWHYNDFPKVSELEGQLMSKMFNKQRGMAESRFSWLFFAIILLIIYSFNFNMHFICPNKNK